MGFQMSPTALIQAGLLLPLLCVHCGMKCLKVPWFLCSMRLQTMHTSMCNEEDHLILMSVLFDGCLDPIK